MRASEFVYLTLAVVLGVLFFAVASFFVSMTMMLVTGRETVLEPMAASGTGILYCLFKFFRDGNFKDTPISFGISLIALTIVFWSLSGFRPFGAALTEFPVSTLIGSLAMIGFSAKGLQLVMRDVPASRMDRHYLELLTIRVLRAFGYVFFVAVVFFPFYVMVISSLKPQSELVQKPLDYSLDWSEGWIALFRGYRDLFVLYEFGGYIATSALVSVVTVALTLCFAVPGAYAVARLRFPGRKALSRSILLIYLVPAIVLVIPLYGIFSLLGLRDSLVGLLIVYPATTLPVAVYMLKGYFANIPAELEEAGMVDGCGRLKVIWRITLPLCLPALSSVGLYVFMIAWNEFLFAFMFLDDPRTFTISRAVVSLNSSEVPRQYLMSGAVLVTLPVLALFLWFERYLVEGLTAGSVKG